MTLGLESGGWRHDSESNDRRLEYMQLPGLVGSRLQINSFQTRDRLDLGKYPQPDGNLALDNSRQPKPIPGHEFEPQT